MLNVEYLHIKDLFNCLNPNNPKIHNLELIIESISHYGFIGGVILNENRVITAGNGRTKAMMTMYQTEQPIPNLPDYKVPCIISNLPEDKLYNYVVDDNLVGMISGGLSQLNNAQLVSELDPENLPLSITQDDYDFMVKVFANDFKKEAKDEPEKEETPKKKLRRINISFTSEEAEQELYDLIFMDVNNLLEGYEGKIKVK